MPDYLYNANPLDDIQYLLNKDTLYYSAYTLLSNHWGPKRATPSTRDSPGTGMKVGETISPPWRTMTGRRLRRRSCPQMPIGTMWPANLAVAERWVTGGIRTRNSGFLPAPVQHPLLGQGHSGGGGRRRVAAIRQAGQTLLQYDNVKFYGYLWTRDRHESGQLLRLSTTRRRLPGDSRMLQREGGPPDRENLEETLANWREFVVQL